MGAQFCEYPPPQDNKKKHKKTPELYQKASPKGEPRTWSLRIAQDDPRWSNMAQDGSKMAQAGPSNSRVSPPSRSEYCQAGRAANMKLATLMLSKLCNTEEIKQLPSPGASPNTIPAARSSLFRVSSVLYA